MSKAPQIIQMCAEGKTQIEIATALECTRSYVSLVGKQYSLKFAKKPKVAQEKPQKRVTLISQYRECAAAGMTLTETARKFNKTLLQVSSSARAGGLVFHVKGKPFGRK